MSRRPPGASLAFLAAPALAPARARSGRTRAFVAGFMLATVLAILIAGGWQR